MPQKGPEITFGRESRQHTKGVIDDKIKRLLQEINALQILHDNLDWDTMTKEQESVLWSYFIKI